MNAVLTLAAKEVRDGLRNRWIVSASLLLAALALSLAFLGSTPTGTVDASRLTLTVVSLASLSIFLLPLIALLLSFDAVVGEQERGTLLLVFAYPVTRLQFLAGKFLGHTTILTLATVSGFGVAGAAIAITGSPGGGEWLPFLALIVTSILLGCVFLGLGYLASTLARERATAAGLAVAVWLVFVVLYDLALLALLVADQGEHVSAGLFRWLLALNPSDLYRLVNLAGFEDVRQLSGLAGLTGEVGLPTGVLLLALGAWVLGPLAATAVALHRREL